MTDLSIDSSESVDFFYGYEADSESGNEDINDVNSSLISSVFQNCISNLGKDKTSKNILRLPKPLNTKSFFKFKFDKTKTEDALLLKKIEKVALNLSNHFENDVKYEVNLVKSDHLNAYCDFFGKITIFSALIDAINYSITNRDKLNLNGYTNPDTNVFIKYNDLTVNDVLANLLAHEMSHAHYYHLWNGLSTYIGLNESVSTLKNQFNLLLKKSRQDLENLSNSDWDNHEEEFSTLELWEKINRLYSPLLIDLFSKFYINDHCKKNEIEADKKGVKLVIEAGYNPVGALFLLDLLKNSNGTKELKLNTIFQNLFSTHPDYNERQDYLYPIIREWQLSQKV